MQRAGDSTSADHPTAHNVRRIRPAAGPSADDELILETLMVPFAVVVSLELADRPAQRGFANQDHAFEACFLHRSCKGLRNGRDSASGAGRRTVSTPAAAGVSRKV